MGRLPYEKRFKLAYQIYEALCAQHPDRWVALSDIRGALKKRAATTRGALKKRAAAALARRPTGGDSEPNSTGNS
jgi:hypothetical protein